MKPQARYEILRALLPALAGAAVLAVLWWAEDWAYDSFWPGIPGDEQGPIGLIPGFPWLVGSDIWYVLSHGDVFLPWALACAFFAVGPLVAFVFSRGKAAYVFSTALLLGVITHGCLNVLSWYAAYLGYYYPPLTLVTLARVSWPGVTWILALSLGGAAIGIGVQMIVRVVARRADRRKSR